MIKKYILLLLIVILIPISTNNKGVEYIPIEIITQKGIASYYADKFVNRRTANGELYKHTKLTAAHKNLPFNTIVRVINIRNNKSVIIRINDRLPQDSKRVIDLSKSAADSLNILKRGLSKVRLEIYI